MNINDYKNLGQDFRERNEGNSGWKNFWIGIAATAVGGIAIGFGKKIGQKAVDGVAVVCKDIYNGIKNFFKEEDTNVHNNKASEEYELLKPIEKNDKSCNEYRNEEQLLALVSGLIYKGEITVMFSPSNAGKSIYALQLAIETAKSNPYCKVIYINQEMKDSQIGSRLFPNGITVPQDYYPANLIIKPRQANANTFIKSLHKSIPQEGGEVFVILDNMTHLCKSTQGNEPMELMSQVSTICDNAKLKRNVTVTTLLVAHSTKSCNELLTAADFKGNGSIFATADAVFAIGHTRDNNRYIVKLKQRNDEFDSKRLYIHQIKKGDSNKPYLHMEFIKEERAEVVFPAKNAKANTSAGNFQKNKKGSHQGKRWEFTDEQIDFLKELCFKKESLRSAQNKFENRFGETPSHSKISELFQKFKE